jgi:23S rRNA pseudouridine955/2504/2580 synthase
MREIIIPANKNNERIDNALKSLFENMPVNSLHKAFRKKDIKVNGTRVRRNCIVKTGGRVQVYLTDEILYGLDNRLDERIKRAFSIIYEDSNILIADKKQGISVHPGGGENKDTLIELVKSHLESNDRYKPGDNNGFSPALCHRLDRNTGGLVIIAKTHQSLKFVLNKLHNNKIKKYYTCLVRGKPAKQSAELYAFLTKNPGQSRVYISDKPSYGALKIITRYRIISTGTAAGKAADSKTTASRLEVELVTGRMHQIRAHLAHIGYPVIGDNKYGSKSLNRSLGVKYQALWASRLVFDYKNTGILGYLSGAVFSIIGTENRTGTEHYTPNSFFEKLND